MLRRWYNHILLGLILIITAFSVSVVFPSEPDRYLPGWVPWPEGRGLHVGSFNRRVMSLGLDLRGGTRLVLQAEPTADNVNLSDALSGAMDIIQRRIDAFGVSESEVTKMGSDRIAVQVPGLSAEDVKQKIGRTALLQFMEIKTDANGQYLIKAPDGSEQAVAAIAPTMFGEAEWIPVSATDPATGNQVDISGAYFDRGKLGLQGDPVTGKPLLTFGMNSQGANLLQQATTRLIGKPMAFFLDDQPIPGADGNIIAPTIQNTISDSGQITGLSLTDAQTLLKLLRAGAFPVKMNVVQEENVDATLGADTVKYSVIAGEVAMALVMLFMILYYRFPGVLAAAALCVYASVVLAIYKLWPVTLTLSGIAAFVLSVGMAVDANILIFERMKEELRIGRALPQAIEAGFDRAWTSIRDSNVSTIITSAILFWFGNQFGAALIKGFALTLAIGVVISMVSAITVTRTFLRVALRTPLARRLWLFTDDPEAGQRVAPEAPGIQPAPIAGGSE